MSINLERIFELIEETLTGNKKLNNLLTEVRERSNKKFLKECSTNSLSGEQSVKVVVDKKEDLNEMEYEGNLGAIEMMKFAKVATPVEMKQMNSLLDQDRYKDAWTLLQNVTHDPLKSIPFQNDMSKGTVSEGSSMAGGSVEGSVGGNGLVITDEENKGTQNA